MKNWTGTEIKKLREKLGLTQKEMADLLRVRRATISEAENEKRDTNESLLLFFEMLDKGIVTKEQISSL